MIRQEDHRIAAGRDLHGAGDRALGVELVRAPAGRAQRRRALDLLEAHSDPVALAPDPETARCQPGEVVRGEPLMVRPGYGPRSTTGWPGAGAPRRSASGGHGPPEVAGGSRFRAGPRWPLAPDRGRPADRWHGSPAPDRPSKPPATARYARSPPAHRPDRQPLALRSSGRTWPARYRLAAHPTLRALDQTDSDVGPRPAGATSALQAVISSAAAASGSIADQAIGHFEAVRRDRPGPAPSTPMAAPRTASVLQHRAQARLSSTTKICGDWSHQRMRRRPLRPEKRQVSPLGRHGEKHAVARASSRA